MNLKRRLIKKHYAPTELKGWLVYFLQTFNSYGVKKSQGDVLFVVKRSPKTQAPLGVNCKPLTMLSPARILTFLLAGLLLSACGNTNVPSDAYGNFEADEVTISAEANGKLVTFNVVEGQNVKQGAVVGIIDTIQLYLRKEQLYAQRASIASRSGNIVSQMDVYITQLKNAQVEQQRVANLLVSGAATQKQMDDANSAVSVLERQIHSVETQNGTVASDVKSIDAQIAQVKDQLDKSYIVNPADGTVLEKYTEQGEVEVSGKALYKIADLNNMYLRVYVSGTQLPAIKIGQPATVLIDKDDVHNVKLPGTVSWISSSAEFTPKIIQTKEERVNLVYAVKIRLKNDGSLKIGMPGEVNFKK